MSDIKRSIKPCRRRLAFPREEDIARRRLRLRVRIPPYKYPRLAWREWIHAEVLKVAQARGVAYLAEDRLELEIKLYLDEFGLRFHDVDNRLKDVMDALQGRVGGNKTKRHLAPVIPNDHQIYKVTVEKLPPPGQSHGMGHLEIRKYK